MAQITYCRLQRDRGKNHKTVDPSYAGKSHIEPSKFLKITNVHIFDTPLRDMNSELIFSLIT